VVGLGLKEAIVKKSPVQNRAFSLFEDFSFFSLFKKEKAANPILRSKEEEP
jgi:hypothetical protein